MIFHIAKLFPTLQGRIMFWLAVSFISVGLLSGWYVTKHLEEQALAEAEDKATLILQQNIAIHRYFTENLHPALVSENSPLNQSRIYDPSWMSSTYAVRTIERYARALADANYYYKECAINARSPHNEADDSERAFLHRLNEDPELEKWSEVRDFDGKPFLAVMYRGEVMHSNGLNAHLSADGPSPQAIQSFGDEHRLKHSTGETVSAISIRIPLSEAFGTAKNLRWTLFLVIGLLLFSLYLFIIWLHRRLLIVPLNQLIAFADTVSQSAEIRPLRVTIKGAPKLLALASAMNRMVSNLQLDRDRLETRVEQQTAELSQAQEARQKTGEAYRQSEERFRKLFDEHDAPMLLIDPEKGSILEANEAAVAFYGYPIQKLKSLKIMDLNISPRKRTERLLSEAAGNKRHQFSFIHRLANGNHRHVEVFSSPIRMFDRTILFSIIHDVSNQVEAKQKLTESEEMYRLLAEHAIDMISKHDDTGHFVYASPSSANLIGYQPEQLVGRKIIEFYHPADLHRMEMKVAQIYQSDDVHTFVYRLRHRDGHYVWVETKAKATQSSPHTAQREIVALTRDISDRKSTEDALRKSERHMRVLLDNLPGMAYRCRNETDWPMIFVGGDVHQLTGYNPEELTQGGSIEYADLIHPDDRDRVWDIVQEAIESDSSFKLEYRIFTRRGDLKWVWERGRALDNHDGQGLMLEGFITDISEQKQAGAALRENAARWRMAQQVARIGNWEMDIPSGKVWGSDEALRIYGIDLDGNSNGEGTIPFERIEACLPDSLRIKDLIAAAETKNEAYHLQHEVIREDTGERLWVKAVAELTRDEEGRPKTLIGTLQDITEQKQVDDEKAKLERQLRHSQKMEAVGRLAGGVAHDFNNLLTGISGNIDLALLDISAGHPLHETLTEVAHASERAANLTRQLLAFSRKQILEPAVVNPNKLLENLRKLLGRLIREDIALSLRLSPDVPQIKVDVGQIEQVIVNLVVNARDAMPKGGRLTIETEAVDLDPEYGISHPSLAQGRYLRIAVSDEGHGMDARTKAQIFEPFFTTKDSDQGTGLGLATSFGIISQHNGGIEVYSEPGRGTTFKVYIPCHIGEEEQQPMKPSLIDLPRGSEQILVVEDEAIVRKIAVKILKRQGYEVFEAESAQDALAMVENDQLDVDLLMTDIVMPHMNGRELATRLLAVRPDLRIIFTSGYTANVIGRHGVLDEGTNFLGKPYSPQGLSQKIREVLDAN